LRLRSRFLANAQNVALRLVSLPV